MKHQTVRDRLHEGEGMVRHQMRDGYMGHERAHGQYENEVEKPMVPKQGHLEHGMGCMDFKGEADSIAYGQASMAGCRSDQKKIQAQFKNYSWDSEGGSSSY